MICKPLLTSCREEHTASKAVKSSVIITWQLDVNKNLQKSSSYLKSFRQNVNHPNGSLRFNIKLCDLRKCYNKTKVAYGLFCWYPEDAFSLLQRADTHMPHFKSTLDLAKTNKLRREQQWCRTSAQCSSTSICPTRGSAEINGLHSQMLLNNRPSKKQQTFTQNLLITRHSFMTRTNPRLGEIMTKLVTSLWYPEQNFSNDVGKMFPTLLQSQHMLSSCDDFEWRYWEHNSW